MSVSCNEFVLLPASVKTSAGTKWGYINGRGKFVIAPQFDRANDFQRNGLAIVESNGRSGVIDETGLFVAAPIYYFIEPFSEGRAIAGVSGGKMRVIDERGRVRTKAFPFIMSYRENRAVFYKKEGEKSFTFGFLDHEGRVVIKPQYLFAHHFSAGKALVKFRDKSHALIGLNGEILQTFSFQKMGKLSEGLLSFSINDQGLTGYINESGKIVISPAFFSGKPFFQGRAVVTMKKSNGLKSGLIDREGDFIIPPEFDEIIMLGEKRAALGKAKDLSNNGKGAVYAIADSENGRIFTDFIYDRVHRFQGEFSSVTKGIYSFFIKKNGVPAANLPLIHGKGELIIIGNVIQAKMDERNSYYDLKGNLIYNER